MRVEGDQPVCASPVRHGERDGVVPTEGQDRDVPEQTDGVDRVALPLGGVRVALIAEVHEHEVAKVDLG